MGVHVFTGVMVIHVFTGGWGGLFYPGVHWDLHGRDVLQADRHGPLLLLPGGLEHLRQHHRDHEPGGAGPGQRPGSVRPPLLPSGERAQPSLRSGYHGPPALTTVTIAKKLLPL